MQLPMTSVDSKKRAFRISDKDYTLSGRHHLTGALGINQPGVFYQAGNFGN